jgi:hypothetical protein
MLRAAQYFQRCAFTADDAGYTAHGHTLGCSVTHDKVSGAYTDRTSHARSTATNLRATQCRVKKTNDLGGESKLHERDLIGLHSNASPNTLALDFDADQICAGRHITNRKIFVVAGAGVGAVTISLHK